MSGGYAHFRGRFVSTDERVWPGGRTTGPYWADGNQSRPLTDEEIERFCKVDGPGWSPRRLDPERDRLTPPPQVV